MMVISERKESQSDDGILYLTGEIAENDAERTYRQIIDYNREGKIDRVQQDVTSGTALGVTSTPRFFVGNEEVRGYQTAAQMGQILDRHLAGG